MVSPSDKWRAALWDIRERKGQDFADRALFYTFQTFDPKTRADQDFNGFFKGEFLRGVSVVDNHHENYDDVVAILKSHGL